MNAITLSSLPMTAAHRRLRIALITETWPPEINGVARTVEQLLAGLLANGHQVQLIRPRQDDQDCPLRHPDLEEILCTGLPLPMYREVRIGLASARRLRRLWRAGPPDVVHVVTPGPLGWSALNAARQLQLPLVTGFHTHFHTYSRHYRLGMLHPLVVGWLRRFHNRGHLTLVPTDEVGGQLASLGISNCRVLARGVDTRLFSPARRDAALRESWGAGPQDCVVACVGRLAAEKNLELAVQAFLAIRQDNPGSRFVLVGDGPLAARLRRRHPGFI
ncbi:MAG: glycosyltransferase, partial [Pseudomonadota bacterium]|nr:glycosyltransferase [Pseudomonadota bacterium]